MKYHFLTTILCCLILMSCEQKRGGEAYADVIYTHGKIYTVDQGQEWAEALAVKSGKILAIGKDEEVLTLKGESTQVIDLEGIGRAIWYGCLTSLRRSLPCNELAKINFRQFACCSPRYCMLCVGLCMLSALTKKYVFTRLLSFHAGEPFCSILL